MARLEIASAFAGVDGGAPEDGWVAPSEDKGLELSPMAGCSSCGDAMVDYV